MVSFYLNARAQVKEEEGETARATAADAVLGFTISFGAARLGSGLLVRPGRKL
jgi:hypothetical protein